MLLQTVLLWSLVAGLQAASHKRGLCVDAAQYHCHDTNTITGAVWWYDWTRRHYKHTQLHCSNHVHGEYVPMVWGAFDSNTLTFPPGTKHVLGFNEPNINNHSNVSPQEAARLWKELENKAHGIKLISPAPATCSPAHNPTCIMDPISWYDQFFAACQGCRVDAVAAHSYTCDAHRDMHYLETLHSKYHRRIWLTEFSCPYTSDVSKVEAYMREIVTLLERAPFVERYSWFITRWKSNGFLSTAINLLHTNSSAPTHLGNLYNHL